MTDFKQCNRCATDCEHRGAIRLCVCGKYTKQEQQENSVICPCCGKQITKVIGGEKSD